MKIRSWKRHFFLISKNLKKNSEMANKGVNIMTFTEIFLIYKDSYITNPLESVVQKLKAPSLSASDAVCC